MWIKCGKLTEISYISALYWADAILCGKVCEFNVENPVENSSSSHLDGISGPLFHIA